MPSVMAVGGEGAGGEEEGKREAYTALHIYVHMCTKPFLTMHNLLV